MRIIIAGAGDVGFHLAKLLSSEAQDIVLIDINQAVLDYAQSHLDVLTVTGDSTSIRTLVKANVKKADLLIAATSSENDNIVAAAIGKRMGAKTTIARINKNEYLTENITGNFQQMGVDALISPKQLAAKEIHKLIREAALTDIYEFEKGKLYLAGIILDKHSMVINQSVAESAELNPDLSYKPIAILRDGETIIPRGSTRFLVNDHIYFITQNGGIDQILEVAGKEKVKVKKIMILGGGSMGLLSAQLLERDYNVKLVEINKDKCLSLAEKLNSTLVINGDGSNIELLKEEDLEEMDAFISLTGNSETNIIASMVAKNHKVRRTIALVENTELTQLAHNVGVDTLINRKLIAANNIFRYIRKGHVKEVTSLPGLDAEVIEYEVKPGASITQKLIKDCNLPEGALIGGVVRGEKSYIPMGGFQIQAGDYVVVFTLPQEINKVEKFFI